MRIIQRPNDDGTFNLDVETEESRIYFTKYTSMDEVVAKVRADVEQARAEQVEYARRIVEREQILEALVDYAAA